MDYNISDVAYLLRQGDKGAYTFLFRELYAPLVSYSAGIAGDRQAAEDIVQHIFCKLWEERGRLAENKSVKAYMYVSVRNLSLNYIRDRKTSLKQKLDTCSDKELSLEIFEEEIYHELYLALSQLPDRCREIFMLKLEGGSNREIAERMGISEETVRSQLRHGRELVRPVLSRLLSIMLACMS